MMMIHYDTVLDQGEAALAPIKASRLHGSILKNAGVLVSIVQDSFDMDTIFPLRFIRGYFASFFHDGWGHAGFVLLYSRSPKEKPV